MTCAGEAPRLDFPAGRPTEFESRMLYAVLAAALAAAPAPSAEPNVIFLTWDGVRWQDFFQRGPDAPFSTFWSKHAAKAAVLGDPQQGEPFLGSNDSIKSLPAYQEMMVGGPVPCRSNLCGKVEKPTLIDRLVGLGLGARMKVVGSWGTLAHAVSARSLPFVDVGLHEGELRPPWGDARKDRDTWAKAMAALEARPRFLWISLNDADEWGHRESRENYVLQLRRYDIWLDELVAKLSAMEGYGGRTTIVCTTDHGRGDADEWGGHGSSLPEARRAFAFALGPGTAGGARSNVRADHRGIRPTLEALLGLEPTGAPLAAFLPAAPVGVQAAP